MRVNNQHHRTIWIEAATPQIIKVIDQRHLPHQFVTKAPATVDEAAGAIRDMHIRGTGLIGATAAYGLYLVALHAEPDHFVESLSSAGEKLKSSRPTAVNLAWAVDR